MGQSFWRSPTMGEKYTGVIDRFEDEKAVVLLEAGGETVDEVLLERDGLPTDGREVDAVLTVEIEVDEVTKVAYDPEETKKRKDDVKKQFDRLSERPPSSDTEE